MAEGDDLRQMRLAKLEKLRSEGIDPYPKDYHRTHLTAQAIQQFDELAGEDVRIAGRIVSMRILGKATFAHIADGSGRIQIYARKDVLGEEQYDDFRTLDIGDFIGVSGSLFRTKAGEITIETKGYTLLAKSLRPLPEKWHGLVDVEKRYRQRYLDLIANPDVRKIFEVRSAVIEAMRTFMRERGFIEVETPALQPLYGGAAARPFETYHQALDRTLYLRIATELYLKRLIVGGFEKVFEIGKNFRNEGISIKHNPEFTAMESYEAYADYIDVMEMVEQMMAFMARMVFGKEEITYKGQTMRLTPPWRRITMRQAIIEATGIDFRQYPDQQTLSAKMAEAGMKFDPALSRAKLIDHMVSTYVEPKLIEPTFVMDFPVEVSPLAKRKTDEPDLVERFEGYIGGMEIANAFTELNDPIDQRERFVKQLEERAAGDEEAHVMDEDYVIALEHGMPPTGGLGIGIDRLVMVFTDQQSIREVILFPQLRTRREE
ncbi:MAG: lysine--tRNA ligase [Chloroflexi bacterium]|nr:lysine--tRNA ligase [Chloroflexota bacterium]